jgi:hypothetical protein
MRMLDALRRAFGSPAARWIPALLVALPLGSASVLAGPPEGPAAGPNRFPAPGAWVPTPAGKDFDLIYLICESGGRARYGISTSVALLAVHGTWTADGDTLVLACPEMGARKLHWTTADAGGLVLRALEGKDATDQPFVRVAAPPELCRAWTDAETKAELELRADHVCRWRAPLAKASEPVDRMGVWFVGDLAFLGGPAGLAISILAGGGDGAVQAFRFELTAPDSLRLRPEAEQTFLREARTLNAGPSPWARFDASTVLPASKDADAPEGVWLAIRRGAPTGEVLRCEAGGRFTRESETVVGGTWHRDGKDVSLVGAEATRPDGSGTSPGSKGVARVSDDGALSVAWDGGPGGDPTRYERARSPASVTGRWRVAGDDRFRARFELRSDGTLTWDDGDDPSDRAPRPSLVGTWSAWGDTLVFGIVSNGARRTLLFSLPFVQADRLLAEAGGVGGVFLLVRDKSVPSAK